MTALCDPPLLPHNREAFAANVALTDAIAAFCDPALARDPAARATARGALYRAYAAYLDAMLGVPATPRETDARHADLAEYAKRIGLTREDVTCAA